MIVGSSATLCELYLQASRLNQRHHVFCIGPYGRRVNFASQQIRALNTIWALEEAGIIREGARVAVIGGGLAGVTTAAALLARRCLVTLYEERPRVLDLQSLAIHRFVHPTINFWPETPISPTTEFPFFDWYAADCAGTIQRLMREWEVYFRDGLSHAFRGTVIGVVYDPAKDLVTVAATGEAPPSRDYDVGIIATGFGEEKTVTGTTGKSYWTKDDLGEIARTARKIIISGTGDGGLIDALRAIHSDFRDGHLTLDLAVALSATGIKAEVRRVEQKVERTFGGKPFEASRLYSDEYAAVLEETPPACLKLLTDSYYRNEPIELVGHLPQPFSLYAAPIHKFMITHALRHNQVTYRQGELRDGPEFLAEGETVPNRVRADICIARHGSEPPLKRLLEDHELRSLKEAQSRIADLLNDIPYQPSFWDGISGYPVRDPLSTGFASFRHPLASAYVNNEYDLTLGISLVKGRPTYMIETEPGRQSPSIMPEKLFGISLDRRPKVVSDDYT